MTNGAIEWCKFAYIGDDADPKNYREWPTQREIWNDAIGYRADKCGYVEVWDGTETPVTSTDDPDINNLKQLINDGYVLVFGTNLTGWMFDKVKDDLSTTADDVFVNQHIVYMDGASALRNDGHAMTVVGYNDDLWVDINKNGVVDGGELGGYKQKWSC